MAFYAVIPINSDGSGPDLIQAPILRKDSTVGSSDGNSFILTENVDFADSNNEVVVARVDNTTGQPTHYAIKSFGKVISGELKQETFTIGEYQRFLRVALAGSDISEIVSVEDSDGREYLEVPIKKQEPSKKSIKTPESSITNGDSIFSPSQESPKSTTSSKLDA